MPPLLVPSAHLGRRLGLLTAVGLAWLAATLVAGQRGQVRSQVSNGLDQVRELATKITSPFTVATVGDIIEMRPIADFEDPAFQAAIRIVKAADVGAANVENSIAELSAYAGRSRGSVGTKEVAGDIKAMGFKMVNRANNWFVTEAMRQTNSLFEAAGVVHVGSGRDLQEARAARYLETSKGRIGMVGMVSTGYNPGLEKAASYASGTDPGTPGTNPIRVTRYTVVTPAQFAALRNVRDALYQQRDTLSNAVPAIALDEPADRLQLADGRFKLGTTAGAYSYAMNPSDVDETMRSIRNGKIYADFMIATIHCHDGPSSMQRVHFAEYPADHLVELAHRSIDNGADIFFAHGEHVVGGVEIYKGRPIFYGLSNFIYQLPLVGSAEGQSPAETAAGGRTNAEDNSQRWAFVTEPDNMEGLLATSRFEGGRLAEVRVYPVDLRGDAPVSRKAIPYLAEGAFAKRVLERVQERSKPFGTRILIEGSVGVIRVPPLVTNSGVR
jgi:poly-gamma-glutamate capsule biosynthesis protein CapA/YwtB (metallophosphatase superfamily)